MKRTQCCRAGSVTGGDETQTNSILERSKRVSIFGSLDTRVFRASCQHTTLSRRYGTHLRDRTPATGTHGTCRYSIAAKASSSRHMRYKLFRVMDDRLSISIRKFCSTYTKDLLTTCNTIAGSCRVGAQEITSAHVLRG